MGNLSLCSRQFTEQYSNMPKLKKKTTGSTRQSGELSSSKAAIDQEALRSYINMIFDKYDSNGDNFLYRGQIKQLMTELAFRRKKVMNQEAINRYVDNFMRKAERYGDGRISRQDFYHYYSLQ